MLAVLAPAQAPKDVMDFFRTAAEALSDDDAAGFLEKFDHGMPGYVTLHDEVETLLAAAEVGSVVEIISDQGDDHNRSLELDWVLEIRDRASRRGIVKCRIERQGKNWKIMALDPVEFFKY